MTATLKWQGTIIGTIHLADRPPSGSRVDLDDRTTLTEVIERGTSGGRRPSLSDFDRIDVRIAYGTKNVDKNLLFLTCIKAMGESAEKGLKTPVPGMIIQGLQQLTFKLLGNMDEGFIEAGWTREAATKAVARMIHDNEYVEAFVWVNVDGKEVAVGGYTQGTSKITS